MKARSAIGLLVILLFGAADAGPSAQDAPGAPYKLGTFGDGNRTFLGLVLNDTRVVDLSKADGSLPTEMKALLARYPAVRAPLAAIAAKPGATIEIGRLRTLPPLLPQHIFNAALNYTEHAKEMSAAPSGTGTPAAAAPGDIPGIWMRRPGDTRHNPYVFPKMPGAVIGHGDTIRLPPGRAQVDWECELAIVIGRTASRVPVERARDHIAGYTLENDVSDRAGRGDGRHGTDWFLGKSHDTFAPLGPFIVPKEFVPDPHTLPITFTLSGKVMQDSSTARMTHSVDEMVSYVSHIMTLQPGDIIATGSPAGVGAARNVFMRSGDTSVCTIGGIGTLSNPVR